jgi:hypothetical protein
VGRIIATVWASGWLLSTTFDHAIAKCSFLSLAYPCFEKPLNPFFGYLTCDLMINFNQNEATSSLIFLIQLNNSLSESATPLLWMLPRF